MRIPSPHIFNELYLLRRVLAGMAERAMRAVHNGLEGAVIAFHPAIAVLPIGLVAGRCLCDIVFHLHNCPSGDLHNCPSGDLGIDIVIEL